MERTSDIIIGTFPRQKTALTSNTGTTPTEEEAKPDGVSTLQNSFQQYHISPEVTDIIMASWRSGTQKEYKVYLENGSCFIVKEKSITVHQ